MRLTLKGMQMVLQWVRRCLCVACLIVVASAVFAQPPAFKTIPAVQWQEDVALLQRVYETLHPGLLGYLTREQLDGLWGQLKQDLNRDLTRDQGFLALSVFLARIQCGHTQANFFNQPKEIVSELLMTGRRLPFHFRLIERLNSITTTDRRMIATRSFTEALQPGDEVLEIDGVPVWTILDKLLTIARADGGNDAKRINYLEVQGLSKYEAFDIYYPLFFPGSAKEFKLKVQPWGRAEAQSITVPATTQAERLAQLERDSNDPARQQSVPWKLEYRDSVAYLKMPGWALYNSKWNWKGFVHETFDQLVARGTPSVILDLRGNEGGLDVGHEIISRLIDKNLTLPGMMRRVRYQKVPDELNPYLDTWDKSFRDWGSAAKEPREGFYRLVRFGESNQGTVIAARGPRYAGKVFILVDAANSSATFQFAQIVQQQKLGTLVGSPTGGNQRGINGGAFFFLRLPRSGIEVDVPLIGQVPVGERPNAGLMPDILMMPTVQDVAKSRDGVLESTLKLAGMR